MIGRLEKAIDISRTNTTSSWVCTGQEECIPIGMISRLFRHFGDQVSVLNYLQSINAKPKIALKPLT